MVAAAGASKAEATVHAAVLAMAVVKQLMSMRFGENVCKRAVRANPTKSAGEAVT
jgi:hypothetical protein